MIQRSSDQPRPERSSKHVTGKTATLPPVIEDRIRSVRDALRAALQDDF